MILNFNKLLTSIQSHPWYNLNSHERDVLAQANWKINSRGTSYETIYNSTRYFLRLDDISAMFIDRLGSISLSIIISFHKDSKYLPPSDRVLINLDSLLEN